LWPFWTSLRATKSEYVLTPPWKNSNNLTKKAEKANPVSLSRLSSFLLPPQQFNPPADEQDPEDGSTPAKPLFIQVVGGDALEPFEEQSLAISRHTYWVAIFAFGAALAAAVFVGTQVYEMTKQTQLLASQSEGANAGALMDEMNTRKQLGIVQKQVDAAQKQANAATREASVLQKQFEAADRPWIAVDVSINSPLTYDSNGVHVGFDIIPKNIGRSPAQNMSIQVMLKPSLMGDNLDGIVKRICNDIAIQGTRWPLRYVLFPGDHYIQPTVLNMSVDDINSYFQGKLPPETGPTDLIPIALVGCVGYTYESSPRHHKTGIALDVLMKDGRLVLRSQTPLAPDSVSLRLHPFGGHFAN